MSESQSTSTSDSQSFYDAADKFTATSGGTTDANGTYWANGTVNGKAMYYKISGGGWYIWWTGIRWAISADLFGDQYYYNTGTGSTPPVTAWSVGTGAAPAPTVAHV